MESENAPPQFDFRAGPSKQILEQSKHITPTESAPLLPQRNSGRELLNMSKQNVSETTRFLDTDFLAEEAAHQVFESAITDADQDDDDADIRWLREQRLQHRSLSWYRKPTVGLVCVVLFLFFVAGMISMASYVELLLQRACIHEQGTDPAMMCSDSRVQAMASSIQAKTTLCTGFVSILVGGKLGEMSDRIGRKPLLLFSCFIATLFKLGETMLLSTAIPFTPWFFAVNGAIQGLGGGIIMMISIASSYVTDIVEPHERTTTLGFTIGSFYLGLGMGPLIGSWIVRKTGYPLYTLYVAAAINTLLFFIVLVAIPESRPHQLRTRAQSMHLQRKASFVSQRSGRSGHFPLGLSSQFNSLFQSFSIVKILWLPRHKTMGLVPRYNAITLVAIECLMMAVGISMGGPLIMYALYRFHANSEFLGYYIAGVGISKTVVLYLVSPILIHLLKKKLKVKVGAPDWIDWLMTFVGIVFDIMTPLIVINATNVYLLLASGMISAVGALGQPAIQSALIKYIPENKTGEMFGALAVLKNILGMIAPSGALFIYSKTVQTMPTMVFYVFLLLLVCALTLVFFVQIHEDIEIADFVKQVRRDSIDSQLSDSEPGPSPMDTYLTRRASTSSPREPVSV